jgi:hypothetical protein
VASVLLFPVFPEETGLQQGFEARFYQAYAGMDDLQCRAGIFLFFNMPPACLPSL